MCNKCDVQQNHSMIPCSLHLLLDEPPAHSRRLITQAFKANYLDQHSHVSDLQVGPEVAFLPIAMISENNKEDPIMFKKCPVTFM